MNDYNDNPYGSSSPGSSDGTNNQYRPNWQTPQQPQEGYYSAPGAYGGQNSYTGKPKEPDAPYQYSYSDYEPPKGGDDKPPKKNKKGLVVFFSIIALVLVISLVSFAGYGIYVMMSGDNFIYDSEGASSSASQPSADTPQLNIAASPAEISGSAANDGGMTNEDIAAKAAPSVVLISNYQQAGIAGEGSGVIMNKEGYIVTNAHVVEGASGLGVTLSSGESYNATAVGVDELTDLAVIKIESSPMPELTVAEFGDSSQLKVGERVIAIGNAGGAEFSSSVTGGMVSALDRQVNTETARLNVIQTDAAINPGNSGGALVNKYGQVIGINSAKFVKEGYEGLGFAIPINNAQPIVNDLIQNGRVTGRPRLGIQGRDMYDAFAQYLGYNVSKGVQIVSIDPDCNISKQGVVVGDILTKMNGEDITSMTGLRNDLITFKPGDVVEFEVYRPSNRNGVSGKSFTIKVTLDEDDGTSNFPQQEQQSQQQSPQQDQNGGGQYPFFPFY